MARKIPAVSLFWPRPLPDPGAPAAPSLPPPQKTPNPASCDENQPSPSPNSAAQQQAVVSSARRGCVAPRLPGGRRSEAGAGCGGHVAERAGGGGRRGAALLPGAAQLGPCLRLQEPAEENAAQEEVGAGLCCCRLGGRGSAARACGSTGEGEAGCGCPTGRGC